MAFHLYTYVMFGYLFPFIATLKRPFNKFSLNNMLLPAIFMLCYFILSYQFQVNDELISPAKAILNLMSLMAGIFLFRILAALYFISTNRTVDEMQPKHLRKGMVSSLLSRLSDWNLRRVQGQEEWQVETYLGTFFRPKIARSIDHYDPEVLKSIFAQHHINASIFEIAAVVSFLIIGSFGENSILSIPAAASGVLLLTTLIMVYSALYSWFKGWTATLVIGILLLINYTSGYWGPLSVESRAYGLNYSVTPSDYNPALIQYNEAGVEADYNHGLEILENWRRKMISHYPGQVKPKLLIINVSGGGLRSALWTMSCMLHADSLSEGKLLDQAHLITGSSGGMIGANYVRDLYYLDQSGTSIKKRYHPEYKNKIASDILNPMIFSAATNDVFIRYQKFQLNNEIYTKDRGYAFEKQLAINTGNVFRKYIKDYKNDEYDSKIPMLIMAPTVVNDGRRLLISAQPVSHLQYSFIENKQVPHLVEDIDFNYLFKNNNGDDLLTTSALRMNATFPYIMPSVNLPTNPPIEVMDAGLRDNFGAKTSANYIYAFNNWIATNTSGVILLRIRDTPKISPVREPDPSLIGRFTAPLGSVYGNVTRTQEMNNEQLLSSLKKAVDFPIDLIDLQLEFSQEEYISLSWHLTRSERVRISECLNSDSNAAAIEHLLKLLND